MSIGDKVREATQVGRRRSFRLPTRECLAGHIVDRRLVLRWTQEQLAEKAGVCRTTVQSIENTRGNPRFDDVVTVWQTLETNFIRQRQYRYFNEYRERRKRERKARVYEQGINKRRA